MASTAPGVPPHQRWSGETAGRDAPSKALADALRKTSLAAFVPSRANAKPIPDAP